MPHSTPAVTVIDAIMGAGKTTWAFDEMERATALAMFAEPDGVIQPELPKYVYVTPFLDEITRAKEECPTVNFRAPQELDGMPKWLYFELLLKEGHNVATTHALFPYLSEEGIRAIKDHGYRLMIDEALDVYDVIKLSPEEITWLHRTGAIQIDPQDGRVDWTLDSASKGHRFDEVKQKATTGSLFLTKGRCLIWKFPRKVLDAFSEITVLTYLFEASTLAPYLRANGLSYQVLSLDPVTHDIIDRDDICEGPLKKEIRSRLRVYEGRMNRMGNYRRGKGRGSQKFTKTYFDKTAKEEDFKRIRGTVKNFVARVAQVPSSKVGWTTFKAYEPKLRGPRYSSPECFIPLNAKASNDWSHKEAMIYLANRCPHPILDGYLRAKGEAIDANLMALSEMLQWLWRGCIRVDGGPPMHAFIPSERMRDLLKTWLESDRVSDLHRRIRSEHPSVLTGRENLAISGPYRPHP